MLILYINTYIFMTNYYKYNFLNFILMVPDTQYLALETKPDYYKMGTQFLKIKSELLRFR